MNSQMLKLSKLKTDDNLDQSAPLNSRPSLLDQARDTVDLLAEDNKNNQHLCLHERMNEVMTAAAHNDENKFKPTCSRKKINEQYGLRLDADSMMKFHQHKQVVYTTDKDLTIVR